jgi:hypothetical protein
VIRTARKLLGIQGFGIAASLGALVALGCGGEKTESPAPETTPAAPAEQSAAKPGQGELWSSTLPDNFPEDIPRYPGASVVKSHSTPESGMKVTFTTPDDPGKVAAYYNDNFVAQGWSAQRVDAPDGTLVLADKGTRSATAGIMAGEGGTNIDLLVVEMR